MMNQNFLHHIYQIVITGTTPAFGAVSAAPAFGAASTPGFGANPAFGATSTAPAFGASSTPAFGTTSTAPPFGILFNLNITEFLVLLMV